MAAKIMISLPPSFLRQVDEVARAEHRSRSELIREAMRFYIEEKIRRRRPLDDPTVRAAYEHVLSSPDTWSGKWDSADEVRKLRDTRRTA